MPVKRNIPYSEGIYFITFTCHRWLPLIDLANGYDIICRWFDHLGKKGHYIIGYVIMPNHIHVLIAFCNTGKNINKEIGEGKRFMAYEIIKRLNQQSANDILAELQQGVNTSDRRRGKLHEVWENSFDWKECISHKFIIQKLDYIHNNPCSGKWSLAESPVDYKYSSATFYINNEPGGYPVTNYMKLEDIDLAKRVNSNTGTGESRAVTDNRRF